MTTPYFDSQASARTILGDEHLQPDLLLPAQWNARSQRIQEPEARLVWAIFEAAWLELVRLKTRRAAEVWFAHPCYRGKGGFSLSDVCDYFGWDTDTVREQARLRLRACRNPAQFTDAIPTDVVCHLLHKSARQVWDMARHGKLTAIRLDGRQCWYSRREVLNLAAKGGDAIEQLEDRSGDRSTSATGVLATGGVESSAPPVPKHAVLPPQSRSEPFSAVPPPLRACGHPMTRENSCRNTGRGRGPGCLICHRRRDRKYRNERSRRERIVRLEEENRRVLV